MPTSCPFCHPDTLARAVDAEGTVFAIPDRLPVTPGHLLVIPRRHTLDWFTLAPEERHDTDVLVRRLRDKLAADDPTITGFNIGINCGASAGQTVMHAHVHLIPRREGDTDTPAGGVRGVVPGKRKY